MKTLALILGIFLLFGLIAWTEEYIRSLSREPISVVIADGLSAEVEAYVQPDFLWAGEAWWIEVRAEVPVLLGINDEWQAVIPPGTNTIFSNHDENNTAKFGTSAWWKVPTKILAENYPRVDPNGGSSISDNPDKLCMMATNEIIYRKH